MGRSLLVRLLRWLPVAVLVFVACNPKSPYLLAVRAWETPALILLGTTGLVFITRRTKRGRLGKLEGGLLAAALCGVCVLATGNEWMFRHQRNSVIDAGAAGSAVGAHFLVGYTRFDEVAVLAERGLIGGIYLGRRNVRGRSIAAIRAEIDALQALRSRAGLPPLIVAADQEGGTVAHMTPPLEAQPSLATLVQAGADATLEARAHAYGVVQGQALAALGVNFNFGPVADLLPTHGRATFDTHTLIHRRAIAADPVVVSRVVSAYGAGLRTQGVTPTLKHFPGLSRVTVDTHHFPARLETTADVLDATDWQPFRAAAPTRAAMMLAHVVIPDIDPTRPASLSKTVVQELLRNRWDYDGLLVTDDLNMGAVYRRGICNAAVEALEAGVDLVLIAYDPDQYYRAMHCAVAAWRRGAFDAEDLARSRSRIVSTTRGRVEPSNPLPVAQGHLRRDS